MIIVFKSHLLKCEINSNMSVLYLQNLGDTIYKNLIKIFNKRFNVNSTTLDGMLNYLDSNDYELVVKYKNVHNFLFHKNDYNNMSISLFLKLLEKATSYGIEVYVNE